MNIPIITRLEEARVDVEGCLVEGIILSCGLSENGTYYSPEVVMGAVDVFRGVQCYADHPKGGEAERSVRDVVGMIDDVWVNEGQLWAQIRLSRAHDWLLTMIMEGLAGDLSINALGRTRVSRRNGRVVREVIEITKAHSVDFVAKAAAGGRVERVVRESQGYEEGLRLLERITEDELEEARPDLFEKLTTKLREKVKEEYFHPDGEGCREIEELEKQVETRRQTLLREAVANKLVEASGLPEKSKQFIFGEAMKIENDDGDFESAVVRLIERHRMYLAGLTSEGIIRGMGSEKPADSMDLRDKKVTLKLMGY
ncbi:MAG: hypothetical protein NTY09_07560 [bacterium]|nr:hypothetical protein [bacterium]